MQDESRLTDIEAMIAALSKRVRSLEEENVLMMGALAKLTEKKADEYWIPGALPETSDN